MAYLACLQPIAGGDRCVQAHTVQAHLDAIKRPVLLHLQARDVHIHIVITIECYCYITDYHTIIIMTYYVKLD